MRPDQPYLPLDEDGLVADEGPPQSVAQFLTLCLLGAREDAGLPSNDSGFDEDVNVYLVGLLERFFEASYHHEAARYLHPSDLDLAKAVRHGRDERLTFRIYKTNADHLLLAIGLFHHLQGSGSNAIPAFRREPGEFVGRGSTYYQLASSSLRRLKRRSSGQELALNKLAEGFEDYASILRRVRGSYFHLTARLGAGTLYHLAQSEPSELDGKELQRLYDAFLDAYSAYLDDSGQAQYDALLAAVELLRRHDPDFAFQMPDRVD